MTDTTLNILIKMRDEASAEIKRMSGSMSTSGNVLKGIFKSGVALAATEATVAIGGMVGLLKSSVNSFNESEKATTQLNAVLASTKGVAGLTSKEIQNIASSLERETTFSDEAILSAENMLLTFTNISKKGGVFEGATEAVLNMSTALGQDLQSSSVQLGKALNDPINGITALRRVGVAFTDEQRDQIATLVESGKTMEAQKIILQELATEFGGSAQAQAETFSGKIQNMNNQIDNMKERLGEATIKALEPFISKLADWVKSEKAEELLNKIIDAVTKFGKWVFENQDLIAGALKIMFKPLEVAWELIKSVTKSMEELFTWIIKTGEKMKEYFGIGRNNNTGTGGGFLGSLSDFAFKAFGGGKAMGGPVDPGKMYVVGESGPELFVPPSSGGQIVPNGAMGGMSISVNVYGPVYTQGGVEDIRKLSLMISDQLRLAGVGI